MKEGGETAGRGRPKIVEKGKVALSEPMPTTEEETEEEPEKTCKPKRAQSRDALGKAFDVSGHRWRGRQESSARFSREQSFPAPFRTDLRGSFPNLRGSWGALGAFRPRLPITAHATKCLFALRALDGGSARRAGVGLYGPIIYSTVANHQTPPK